MHEFPKILILIGRGLALHPMCLLWLTRQVFCILNWATLKKNVIVITFTQKRSWQSFLSH